MRGRIKLLAQPRVPGVTRLGSHEALPPIVDDALRAEALRAGVTLSRLKAGIICNALGVDHLTCEVIDEERYETHLGRKYKRAAYEKGTNEAPRHNRR